MLCNVWRVGALAAGACIALAGSASAGDEAMRLDSKNSSASLTDGLTQFSHAERAKATDDDLEDVHYRYNRGYYRGSNGGAYYLPRFYAFRSGYWNGYSGGGYYGRPYYGGAYFGFRPWYGYPSVAYYSAPVYSTPVYYSAPAVTYYYPIGEAGVAPATYTVPSPRPNLHNPEPPLAPAGRVYPYGGPTTPMPTIPKFRYDGDPATPVPMPGEPTPKMKDPAPKIDPADGRFVKMQPAAKKYSYSAYGENRADSRDTLVVKQKN
jgi:hypothetical protein